MLSTAFARGVDKRSSSGDGNECTGVATRGGNVAVQGELCGEGVATIASSGCTGLRCWPCDGDGDVYGKGIWVLGEAEQ